VHSVRYVDALTFHLHLLDLHALCHACTPANKQAHKPCPPTIEHLSPERDECHKREFTGAPVMRQHGGGLRTMQHARFRLGEERRRGRAPPLPPTPNPARPRRRARLAARRHGGGGARSPPAPPRTRGGSHVRGSCSCSCCAAGRDFLLLRMLLLLVVVLARGRSTRVVHERRGGRECTAVCDVCAVRPLPFFLDYPGTARACGETGISRQFPIFSVRNQPRENGEKWIN
jgi:hypothetical protein